MKAFKLGIIDKDGAVLRKAADLTTDDEKSAYTVFHRLVFNFKRLLGLLPMGKTKLASYAAALWLIKEETGMSEEQIKCVLSRIEADFDFTKPIVESLCVDEKHRLMPGVYKLKKDVVLDITGEPIAMAGTKVIVRESVEPSGIMFGTPVYMVQHQRTMTQIFVSAEDLKQ